MCWSGGLYPRLVLAFKLIRGSAVANQLIKLITHNGEEVEADWHVAVNFDTDRIINFQMMKITPYGDLS